MKTQTMQIIRYWILATLVSVLLTACNSQLPIPLQPATPTPTSTQTPEPTATPTPTPTSTPLPPLAVLLAGPGSDPSLASTYQTALHEMVTSAGLRWQVRQRLEPEDLNQALRLVVVLPPDPGVANLAAAAPGTRFLAVDIPGLQPSANLSMISAQGGQWDQQGFIAGVMAAMLTPEWRVGVLSVGDTVEGRSARSGFLNGVVYYCGLCRPAYPPFYSYPLYIELPAEASSAEWQAAADYLIDRQVEMVYVYPDAGDDGTLRYLAQAGIKLISSRLPPDDLRPSWVASLGSDLLAAVLEILPQLLEGNAEAIYPLPLEILQVNSDLFSPGRQRLANEILGDLLAGYIDPGVDPANGEPR